LIANELITLDQVLVGVGKNSHRRLQSKKKRAASEKGLSVRAVTNVIRQKLQENSPELCLAASPAKKRVNFGGGFAFEILRILLSVRHRGVTAFVDRQDLSFIGRWRLIYQILLQGVEKTLERGASVPMRS